MTQEAATQSTTPTTPLPQERHDQIIGLLEKQGSVRVAKLAERFSVAEETIRRDLERLGEAGLLVRTHGGALRIRDDRQDAPIAVRRTTNAAQKRAIAAVAVPLVQEGETIALDSSSTALELASALPDIPLTVVTNSLDAVRVLAARTHITATLTGGELAPESRSLLGPIAEGTLRQFAFDKVFFSCKAIDPRRGLSEASVAHASLKRWLLDLADASVLLADHSKFGVRSVSFFGMLTEVGTLVTDDQTNQDFLGPLEAAGVQTLIAAPSGANAGP
ncbi:Glucitol operon repressor [Posidoniimonas corsicana]|uniref:Glucitol operon repressor n=1 Tax=Posidoniimonas corsicana TaxID=1938618 RepID=A0A5C5V6H2_9BACT|nr:DeoR/GlpR family DNA-binding transcription regulator [Posidoniimonas corsicana]TWT33509.1 Glucitol operon repressor [Posidoniimonas corsicana]